MSRADEEIPWQEGENGYKHAAFVSHHGGITQRWLLVYSEQAYAREKKTLEKNFEKKESALKRVIWHLGNEVYGSDKDAKRENEKLKAEYPLYHVSGEVIPILKYAGKGKPSAGETPVVKGYKVDLVLDRKESVVAALLNRKCRFF